MNKASALTLKQVINVYDINVISNFQLGHQQRRAASERGADATAELWESARELAREGRFDEIPAQLYIQHMRNFQLIYREERNKRTPIEEFELRAWQQDLLDKLEGPVDNRKIYWYWEETGNVGKSWMATFLLRNYDAITVSSGKTADIAYLLDNPKIVVFDIARDAIDHVNFGVMEDIKNGRIFSPKYESAVKSFDIPHLVVFANCPCPHGKFSADRIDSINLTEHVRTLENLQREREQMNIETPNNEPENLNAAYAPGFRPAVSPIARPNLTRRDSLAYEPINIDQTINPWVNPLDLNLNNYDIQEILDGHDDNAFLEDLDFENIFP